MSRNTVQDRIDEEEVKQQWEVEIRNLQNLNSSIQRTMGDLKMQRSVYKKTCARLINKMKARGLKEIVLNDVNCVLTSNIVPVRLTSKQRESILKQRIEKGEMQSSHDWDDYQQECADRATVKIVENIELRTR